MASSVTFLALLLVGLDLEPVASKGVHEGAVELFKGQP